MSEWAPKFGIVIAAANCLEYKRQGQIAKAKSCAKNAIKSLLTPSIPGTAAIKKLFGKKVATPAKRCSFSGETRVLMADGSTKPISEIEVGDKVIATDPETGEQVARKVTKVWVHDDTVIDLRLKGGGTITTTKDHRFYNATDEEFQQAAELDRGDKVLTDDGNTITVMGLVPGTARTAVAYNLTVQGIHTYHVGYANILVHNECFPQLSINGKQLGTKWGKHSADYGMKPSDASGRAWYRNRIEEVYSDPDEIRRGPYNPTAGGGNGYFFFRKGNDVVIMRPDGQFVTMFPGTDTTWFKGAKVLPR